MDKASLHGVRIVVPGRDELPSGAQVLVEVAPLPQGRIGIREPDWRDDPEAVADRDWWIQRIEPIELTPHERADHERFEVGFRRYSIEAVRRQMEEGTPDEPASAPIPGRSRTSSTGRRTRTGVRRPRWPGTAPADSIVSRQNAGTR